MINENNKIEPKIIKLQDRATPPLTAGEYSLKAKLSILGKSNHDDVASKEIKKEFNNLDTPLTFKVSAPRFLLEPDLLHSVYPPASSVGAYHNSLPHIYFNRKTLPWERTISEDNDAPWMTLLLLTAKEMQDNEVLTASQKVTELQSMNVIKTPDNSQTSKEKKVQEVYQNLKVPKIDAELWEEEEVAQIIQMPLNLFKSICPLIEELPFLSHARQVDTSLKENAAANPKGWFSVIVGNRLPQEGEDNFVFLVSLEGHYEALSTEPDPQASIRLVVLEKWMFKSKGSTFEELCEELIKNTGHFRIEKKTENKDIRTALQHGYVPMNHRWRDGKNSVSWYRGPLVPVDIATPEKYKYNNADEALRFDKSTGMFDISYATAWQLGRVLALQNTAFSAALGSWNAVFKRGNPLDAAIKVIENEEDMKSINVDQLTKYGQDVASNEILKDFILEQWEKSKQ